MAFYGLPFNITADNSNIKIQIINYSGIDEDIMVPIDTPDGDIKMVPFEVKAPKPHNPYGDSPYWSPAVSVPANPFTQNLPKERPPEIYQPEIKKQEEQKPSNDHLEIV